MSTYKVHIPAPYVHPIYTDNKIDTPVGSHSPLPVQILARNNDGTFAVSNTENAPFFRIANSIRFRTNDTLLVTPTTIVATTNRDLLGSTATELPTLDVCGQYRKLVWFYFRAAADATNYRILARATDHNGAPLASGWQELVPATTLPGAANTWGRIEIPASGDGYYDQYRIEVWRTAGSDYSLTSKIIGVR